MRSLLRTDLVGLGALVKRAVGRVAVVITVTVLTACSAFTSSSAVRSNSRTDPRFGVVILPGSGSRWVAFTVRNTSASSAFYGLVGSVDRWNGSTWHQVDYFTSSDLGGMQPGALSRN